MKKRALSQAQLAALVWAGVLAPAAELLPGAALSAGRGAWLAPLAALPLALLSVWLLTRLARDRGLARGILDGLGPWLGRGVLLFYMVWALGLLALRLRLCAGRMLSSGYRDGALPYFLLAAASWGTSVGLAAVSFGRGRRTAPVVYGRACWVRFGACCLALLAGVCAELFLSPVLLRLMLERILG